MRLTAIVLLVLAMNLPAQSTFEAASIKAAQLDKSSLEGQRGVAFSPGSLTMRSATLRTIILTAYDVKDHQISGPSSLDSERYDIVARAAGPATDREMRPMLQALLQDRFKLQSHRETREMPVFILTAGKGGVRLRPSTTECIRFDPNVPVRPRAADEKPVPFCNNIISGRGAIMRWTAQNIDVFQLVGALSSSVGRQVIDKTGFTGHFDLNLEYSPDPAPADAPAPPLITVLEQDLGLKLDSGKGPVEVLVIDHIERPSEN